MWVKYLLLAAREAGSILFILKIWVDASLIDHMKGTSALFICYINTNKSQLVFMFRKKVSRRSRLNWASLLDRPKFKRRAWPRFTFKWQIWLNWGHLSFAETWTETYFWLRCVFAASLRDLSKIFQTSSAVKVVVLASSLGDFCVSGLDFYAVSVGSERHTYAAYSLKMLFSLSNTCSSIIWHDGFLIVEAIEMEESLRVATQSSDSYVWSPLIEDLLSEFDYRVFSCLTWRRWARDNRRLAWESCFFCFNHLGEASVFFFLILFLNLRCPV